MRRFGVFAKAMRDLRWQVFWYGLGLAALAALVVYIYPSYREQIKDFELPEAFRALIGDADYGTPEGFLAAEFFSWVPILVVIFAIMAGTSALAGEEAEGTLDLLLAQPISRGRLVMEKMAGFAISAVLITAINYVGWLLSVPFVDIDISYGRLLIATLQLLPLILVFGAVAMWCGAFFPDRRLATGVATAFAVASFFVNYISALVEALEPLAWMSVFHYANGSEAMINSADPAKSAVLLAVTAAFAFLALASFERRDLGVRGGVVMPIFLRPSSGQQPASR